jgi:hypothetical protein
MEKADWDLAYKASLDRWLEKELPFTAKFWANGGRTRLLVGDEGGGLHLFLKLYEAGYCVQPTSYGAMIDLRFLPMVCS